MPNDQASWDELTRLATQAQLPGPALRAADPENTLQVTAAGITADLRKQGIDGTVLKALVDLAQSAGLPEARRAMLAGEAINNTEDRAVLHTALRADEAALQRRMGAAGDLWSTLCQQRRQEEAFVRAVRDGHWRGYTGQAISTVVHIGIGGSHLGPELIVDALHRPGPADLAVRFLSNIDGNNLARVVVDLDPARTLFIIASKSFTTQETAVNAASVRAWFLERTGSVDAIAKHFVAISNNLEAAGEFGIPPENLFAMGEWVGGRYSLWSAVGLPIALALGWEAFEALLGGAGAMDEHFETAPVASNLPVLLALVGVWNSSLRGCHSHVLLPYDDRLRLLPDYLQQLDMESNGKGTRKDGTPVTTATGAMLWGGRGTNGQHAFHQLLHQGTQSYSADFIICRDPAHAYAHHHQYLNANALAQSEAMAMGRTHDDPHRVVPGDRPSTTLVLPALTPATLGALLAAYEHKVFSQGVLWGINSFDQWGVELGKVLAGPIHAALTAPGADAASVSPATAGLIHLLQNGDPT
ncbi:MAG: glucose-6-phosphate isomerase [Pseudomonadota bacterium]